MRQADQAICQPLFGHFIFYVHRGKVNRFIPQPESAPMDNHHFFSLEVLKGPDRLGRVHMALFHKPAGFIGPQVKNGKIGKIFGFLEALKRDKI